MKGWRFALIVGTSVIPSETLRSNLNSLRKYAEKLIPKFVEPLPTLIANNLYYLGLNIRKVNGLDYRTRTKAIDTCMSEVPHVRGVLNVVTDVDDMFRVVDMNQVLGYVFGGKETDLSEEELHLRIERLLCRTKSKKTSTS